MVHLVQVCCHQFILLFLNCLLTYLHTGKTLLIQALFIAMDRPFGNGLFLTLGGRLSQ
jgi:hypothetical protein